MPSIADHLNRLKQVVVGTKTSNIDNQLDSISKEISNLRSQNSRSNQIEIIKNLISKSDFQMPQAMGSISGGAMSPGMIGQASRLARYNMFESITTYIPYCNRALQVITDNIISPDDITKTCIDVKPKTKMIEDVGIANVLNCPDMRNLHYAVSYALRPRSCLTLSTARTASRAYPSAPISSANF